MQSHETGLPAFRRLGQTFAAECSPIDLRRDLTPGQVLGIEAALAEHGVVVFRDQPLDEAQQAAFIRKFGPDRNVGFREVASGNPMFVDVGTVDDRGDPIPMGSARGQYLLANRLWHTDGSFMKVPVRLTALLARQLPPDPPATEFADLRAAWSALAPQRQAELEGLKVFHSILRSRERVGLTADRFDAQTLRDFPGAVQPLVRSHPLNSRQSLYLASHASHVDGWPQAEGRALLEELIEFATQPAFVYSHAWLPHDLVMWDDRWTMHRATSYDGPHPRKMRQAAVHELQPL